MHERDFSFADDQPEALRACMVTTSAWVSIDVRSAAGIRLW